jgi:hypothetical protein
MLWTATAFNAGCETTIVTAADLAFGHILAAFARAEAYALHGVLQHGIKGLPGGLGKVEGSL